MKYSLGIWQVDSQENKIKNTQSGKETRMSPRAMEVLSYFLQNPLKVISLDELIEEIWLGRIVGDHAVYRVINKIRKHLDPQNKDAYIETIPRMGYKLVHSVKSFENLKSSQEIGDSAVEESEFLPNINQKNKQAPTKKIIFGIGVLLTALLIFLIVKFFTKQSNIAPTPQDKEVQTYNSFLPFVSMQGYHDYLSSSANGRYIVFSYEKLNAAGFNIYLKDLQNNQIKQITQSNESDFNAKISNDAKTIVFIRQGLEGCEVIHLKYFESTYLEENLFNCIDNENLDIALSQSGSKLFYTFKDNENTNNSIYSMVVNTGEREQLTSAALNTLSGKSEIALSDDENIIYFLTTDNSHQSTILSYDLTKREEKTILQKTAYLENLNIRSKNNSLTFNTNNTSVSEYSLNYLIETEIITSLSERIYSYDFIGNTDAVVMVTGNEENSIWQKSLKRAVGLEQITVSTYQDIYPSYSNSGEYISFISNRGGQKQLWLKTKFSNATDELQLTNFKNRDLTDWFMWSPDDSKILSYNGVSIYWIDSESGQAVDLVLSKEFPDAKYPSWSNDGQSVYFSSSKSGEIQLYVYDLKAKTVAQYSNTGVIALFDRGANGRYFFKAYRQGLWKNSQGIEKLIVPNIRANKYVHSVDFTNEGVYFLKDLSYQVYFYRFLDLEDSIAQNGRVVIEPKKINTILPNKYLSVSPDNEKIIFYKTNRERTSLLKNR